MGDLVDQGSDATPTTNYVPEITQLRDTDAQVNQIMFSNHNRSMLGAAQDDAKVTLYDVEASK